MRVYGGVPEWTGGVWNITGVSHGALAVIEGGRNMGGENIPDNARTTGGGKFVIDLTNRTMR